MSASSTPTRPAGIRQGHGEVHRDRGLADAALAGGDRDHLGQGVGARERDLALGLAAPQLVPQRHPLLVAHHPEVDPYGGHPRHRDAPRR